MKANKKKLYAILLLALVVLAGVSSFFLYYFYKMRNDNLSFNKIDIQESEAMTYSVQTKDSDFYTPAAANKTYITEEVKNVKGYFNYLATYSSNTKFNYSYIVEGKIVGNSKGTSDKILEKQIYKNAPEVKQLEGRILNITDTFLIDVQDYMELKKSFIDKYEIELDAYIQYDVTITYSYDSPSINKSKVEKRVMTLMVPLSEKTTVPKVPANNNKSYAEYSDLTERDRGTYLAICLELLGSVILFVLTAILVLKRLFGRTTMYKKELNSLLKKYDKAIVKLKNLPDFDNIDVLFVDSFDDLLDACYVTDKPINYYEVIKDKEAIFVLFNDFKAYVYNVSIRNEE